MTQQQQILQHLQRIGPITPIEALTEYGCFRLAARVGELKRAGHDIRMILVSNGRDRKRFARYELVGK